MCMVGGCAGVCDSQVLNTTGAGGTGNHESADVWMLRFSGRTSS